MERGGEAVGYGLAVVTEAGEGGAGVADCVLGRSATLILTRVDNEDSKVERGEMKEETRSAERTG
jgi:hypothetical protein